MQQHTSMRAAADTLAADAARKARIAAAQARTKAAQLRRAKRKVSIASIVHSPCPSSAALLLAHKCQCSPQHVPKAHQNAVKSRRRRSPQS